MQSKPIPKRRWQLVSTDLFTDVKKEIYVIDVDHMTQYWNQLNYIHAESTILQMRRYSPGKGSLKWQYQTMVDPSMPARKRAVSMKGIDDTIQKQGNC